MLENSEELLSIGVFSWDFKGGMKRLTDDERMFFDKMPQLQPLYEKLKGKLQALYPDMAIKITKTQISFRNRTVFAMASLPWRKVRGWPKEYLLVSFGLPYQKESPRIVQSVEAYPNRWTHHVILEREEEIEEELIGWLQEAYRFSLIK